MRGRSHTHLTQLSHTTASHTTTFSHTSSHTTHLTQAHLTQLICISLFSRTFAWQLLFVQHFDCLGLCRCAFGRRRAPRAFAWQAQHSVHLASYFLRGRRSTLTVWDLPVRVWSPEGPRAFAWQAQHCIWILRAGATLCASGATFAWQAQHFDCLGLVPVRVWSPLGPRRNLRGRRSTLCIWATFAWQAQHFDCLGLLQHVLAKFGRRRAAASRFDFAWQAQHFVHLALLLRGRAQHFDCLGSVGARAPLSAPVNCVAGTLCASGATFAWQAQHFVHLGYFCVAGAAL